MPSIVSPIASITASRDSNPRGLAHFQNSVQDMADQVKDDDSVIKYTRES